MSSESGHQKDLVLLVPDCNYEKGLNELLQRSESLGIRPISFGIYVHMHRDPGCLLEAHEFLRALAHEFHYALVLFDRDGCGHSGQRDAIQREVQTRLSRAGWSDRSDVLVTDPELDAWVWSDSPNVDRALGWGPDRPPLRDWLRQRGLLDPDGIKPRRPKEAMEQALRAAGRPRSASIYAQLGKRVGVNRCTDATFAELRQVLQRWFPPSPGHVGL